MKKKVLFSIIGIALFAVAIGFGINDKKEASLTVKNIEALASHGGMGDETKYECVCEGNWFTGYECNASLDATNSDCAPSGTQNCWEYDGNC